MDSSNNWNILIADDDKNIHKIKVNPFFQEEILGKPINFISAFTKEDAFRILEDRHNEISVILFDIILTEGNGIDVIEYIRNDLGNEKIQIIIRSDASIDFSKREITDNYIIHDYIDDDDKTDGKLYFTIKSAISTYNDIKKLEKRNEETNKQKEVIEYQKQASDKSTNAASLIQRALFPKEELLAKNFPDSFIIHEQQQDIGGDFYYFNEILGKIIIIAADCTHHGIQAALTSMLGISFLKRIIEVDKVFDPANILTKLDYEILNIFKNKNNEGEVHDGMDISICTFDMENKTLLVSGAINSIHHIRGNSINEHKVSKYAVGHMDTSHKNFNTELIPLEKDDIIYMYSDGFSNQLEANNKAFGKDNFFQMLGRKKKKSMDKQKEYFLMQLIDMTDKNEQTDDILIIGIKIP